MGRARAARSAAASQASSGRQSSSVKAMQRAAAARQPALRMRAALPVPAGKRSARRRAGGGEWVVAQHGVGRRAGRVVHDDDLPLVGRRRLRGQRVEQHAQAARTLVRGHDDREQRPVAHRAPANAPAPTAAYRSAYRAATPSQP